MDFGGFNSAERTPPSASFSPVQDISSPCRILVRNPSAPAITSAIFLRPCSVEICEWVESHSTFYRERTLASEIVYRLRKSWHLAQLKWWKVIRSRSFRNPYVARFNDPMTDGCQGTKDFLFWQNFFSLQSSVFHFSYKVSYFQRLPVTRHRRVHHKRHASPVVCKLL